MWSRSTGGWCCPAWERLRRVEPSESGARPGTDGGLPPARLAEDARSSRFLSLLERQRIATLRARGLGGARDRRAPGTFPVHHQPRAAAQYAPARSRRLRRGSGSCASAAADPAPASGTSAGLRRLRTGRPLRKRRRRPDQRQPRFIAPALLIDHRPTVVEHRHRVGDWEGDLITGRLNQSAIATPVDRKSRYLRLVPLPARHDAQAVRDGLIAVLDGLPATVRLTLTWDQGAEMACHDEIAPYLREGVYFAHAGSPWQRGTNENTNGLLRQYFPKRTDLSAHTEADLRAIEERLNKRPRKTLGWRTPADIFYEGLAL
nr:IS30 family transposase [Nonomuraea terrae]